MWRKLKAILLSKEAGPKRSLLDDCVCMCCPEKEDVGPGRELLLWHGMRTENNCFRVQGLPRSGEKCLETRCGRWLLLCSPGQ